jgi:hypothetical protein
MRSSDGSRKTWKRHGQFPGRDGMTNLETVLSAVTGAFCILSSGRQNRFQARAGVEVGRSIRSPRNARAKHKRFVLSEIKKARATRISMIKKEEWK